MIVSSTGHRVRHPGPLATVGAFVAVLLPILAALVLVAALVSFHPPHAVAATPAFALMADSALLVEKRQELSAKAKLWDEAEKLSLVEGGGGRRDMSRKELLEKLGATDAADAMAKSVALHAEITDLNAVIDDLHWKEMRSDVSRVNEELKKPIRTVGVPSSQIANGPNTFGQMVVDSKGFMDAMRGRQNIKIEVDVDLKTLLQTSAGLQPRTDNGTRVVEKVIRPVQLLDRIPTDTTDLFEIPYMEETTRTQAAAEVAEAGTYAEDAFAFTRRTSTVRKVGSQIPVTDEQLQDVGGMRALLDNRLRFGLEARLDQQILVGDGTPPNLQGIFTVSGIQTQAKGADSTANAIFKAMTLVRITGRSVPDTAVIHGTDWQNIRLAQNAQGDYFFGPPTMVGTDTLWGIPVVQDEALTAGNAVVGAFTTQSQLLYKKGVEVQVGWISTQFIEGKVTLRADVRAAFAIWRPAAFAKITGL